jgi:hypothetical protein
MPTHAPEAPDDRSVTGPRARAVRATVAVLEGARELAGDLDTPRAGARGCAETTTP